MVAKVLDFTRREQTDEAVGTPRELAIRCDGFRVTLPGVRRGRDLENPFERVVLRLLELRRYDVDGAGHRDLPARRPGRFILLRLVDKGYIDERHDLLDAGRAALGKLDRATGAEVDYRTSVVFRERIGGRLLPMLVAAEDLPVRGRDVGDGLVVFVGTEGDPSNSALAGGRGRAGRRPRRRSRRCWPG